MLATIVFVLGGFSLLVWRTYRKGSGQRFEPEGKLRWTDKPS